MKLITKNFKTALQGLLFDQELVTNIKKAKLDKEHLYNHLISGKITLEEYVQAVK